MYMRIYIIKKYRRNFYLVQMFQRLARVHSHEIIFIYLFTEKYRIKIHMKYIDVKHYQ